jgi:hypothetical protein
MLERWEYNNENEKESRTVGHGTEKQKRKAMMHPKTAQARVPVPPESKAKNDGEE